MTRLLSTSITVAAAATLLCSVHGFQIQRSILLSSTSSSTISGSGSGSSCSSGPSSSSSSLSMIATNDNEQQQQQQQQQQQNDAATTATTTSNNMFFEDDRGHINSELAQRIYKWEQDQRLSQNLPKFQYSTRQGLRWVLDCVKDYGDEDLMQEGVIALMQAMTEFERKAPSKISFEAYCKRHIQHALNEYKRTGSRRGKAPPLSVESTVKIDDPLETHYTNQDEWEVREGLVLDNGQGLVNSHKATKQENDLVSVEDFLDETIQYEGEDQMWVHQQQVAAPLQHSIPDVDGENENNADSDDQDSFGNDIDDRFLADMIRYDVDQFLGSTLEELESQVIQMRFGLGDEPMTQKQVAFELGLGSVAKVRKIQKQALKKLRNAYADRYAAGGDNDNQGEDGNYYWEEEDTV